MNKTLDDLSGLILQLKEACNEVDKQERETAITKEYKPLYEARANVREILEEAEFALLCVKGGFC